MHTDQTHKTESNEFAEWVLNAVPVPLFFLLVQLITAVILLQATACLGEIRLGLAHLPV